MFSTLAVEKKSRLRAPGMVPSYGANTTIAVVSAAAGGTADTTRGRQRGVAARKQGTVQETQQNLVQVLRAEDLDPGARPSSRRSCLPTSVRTARRRARGSFAIG